jgi:NAD(P)-dependent dehydrogenase (short-subunit alcohol dehydrogenase family)
VSLTLDLSGRVALVTGGYRGVGAGISTVLAEAGATVVTCGRREAEPVPGTTHRLCDVRETDSVRALVEGVVADHGSLDVVVNNAGGSPWGLAAETDAERHRKIIELNLVSPLVVSQVANAVMQRQRDGGSIVSISSVSGVRPSPGTASYGAAKAGLDHLTRSLAIEWAPKVRINTIDLGMTSTPALEDFYGDPAAVAALAEVVPMKRLATPTDAGQLVAFLCSPLAAHLTGACIELHGGGEAKEFFEELKEERE